MYFLYFIAFLHIWRKEVLYLLLCGSFLILLCGRKTRFLRHSSDTFERWRKKSEEKFNKIPWVFFFNWFLVVNVGSVAGAIWSCGLAWEIKKSFYNFFQESKGDKAIYSNVVKERKMRHQENSIKLLNFLIMSSLNTCLI